MVSGQLDYYNSLLYRVNKTSVAKLQKVKNDMPHCLQPGQNDFVTPYLKNLH